MLNYHKIKMLCLIYFWKKDDEISDGPNRYLLVFLGIDSKINK